MSYPLLALQQAVYARLLADATLQNLINGIYDQPPADAVHPFVAIESVEAEDWSFKGAAGMRAVLELATYSRYHGKSECHGILSRITSLLHEVNYTAEGYEVVQSRVIASSLRSLSDLRTTRGLLKLELYAHTST